MRKIGKERLSKLNNLKRREELGILGNSNLVLHHIDPTLKYNDYDRYILWLPEDTVVMTRGKHTALHNLINSEKRIEKMRQSLTGKKHSKEHNENIGKWSRGKTWKVIDGKRVWI